jgi:ABC-2 type transport system ATP-binding protein
MTEPILVVNHLSRSFGAVNAVNDVSLNVSPGQIYGLVGPDGAGKTTTLRLICGAFKPESGSVTIGGFPLEKQAEQAREMIGYLSQQFSLYEDLTVLENIRFLAEVRGLSAEDWLPKAHENLAFVGLDAFENRLAGKLSGGMKQKLGLACALVNRPRLLLLDEPTTGVDPVTRQDFWQLVIHLAGEQGMAVLVCTPYMDEASRCSHIGFMRNGRIIQDGSPSKLRSMLTGRVLELSGSPVKVVMQAARSDPGVQDAQRFGDRLHLRVAPGQTTEVKKRLTTQIRSTGGTVLAIKEIPPLLEDVFIDLAGESSPSIPVEDGVQQ